MLSNSAKKQKELKENYKVYRWNFLVVWVLSNILFAYFTDQFIQQRKTNIMYIDGVKTIVANCGHLDFLVVFAAYLATLVIYKLVFAAMHIIHFKILTLDD